MECVQIKDANSLMGNKKQKVKVFTYCHAWTKKIITVRVWSDGRMEPIQGHPKCPDWNLIEEVETEEY